MNRVGDGRTVLVVDDEPDLCEIVRRMLDGRGYAVLTAASFAQGGNAKRWNKWQTIEGKQFFCGDHCEKQPIEGPSGCPGEDPIGPFARLIIKIDNLAGADEAMINTSTVKDDFAGRVKPCCNTCGKSGGRECGCEKPGLTYLGPQIFGAQLHID